MSKVKVYGCGGSEVKAELDVSTDDFAIEINGKQYRFAIKQDNSLEIALINGVDVRITSTVYGGYPAVKLIHK